MKLSISNIAWTVEQDEKIYQIMKDNGFEGLEIAPTRIFPMRPYDKLKDAARWSNELYSKYGFCVSSMQSIWYGKQEKIFGSESERALLIDYTKKAIDFAAVVGCRNLVFGCPKNRRMPDEISGKQMENIVIPFFRELGDYAYEKDAVVAMEANPPIYNTNFINDTISAFDLIEKVDSKGFLLNLDIGAMIEDGEGADILVGRTERINHVHISEPGLALIRERQLHRDVVSLLEEEKYDGFISIEMGRQEDISALEKIMRYVKEIR